MNNRTGETRKNINGYDMTIVKYDSCMNICVVFDKDDNKNIINTNYSNFKKGKVKYRFEKSVVGIGYLGYGKYNKKNYRNTYYSWHSMFHRCYSGLNKAYTDCTVCEEWHNFQTFAKWYEDNYYEVEGEKIVLDKDILLKGNKIYSPKTCSFVPEKINLLFVKNNINRGNCLIGVTKNNNKNNSYYAKIKIAGKTICLGEFKTEEEAFLAYKKEKEKNILMYANIYKNYISYETYEAMKNYVVDMTD